MLRAIILGLTPEPLGTLESAWTLLTAITLNQLVAHRNEVSVALASGLRRRRSAEAALVYHRIITAFQSAISEEHARAVLLRKQMRRAGLPPYTPGRWLLGWLCF